MLSEQTVSNHPDLLEAVYVGGGDDSAQAAVLPVYGLHPHCLSLDTCTCNVDK